jgi:hypothetical protein
LVIVVEARTPNVVVVPGLITGAAALDEAGLMKIASSGNNATAVKTLTLFDFFMPFRFCCVSKVRHIGFKPLASLGACLERVWAVRELIARQDRSVGTLMLYCKFLMNRTMPMRGIVVAQVLRIPNT